MDQLELPQSRSLHFPADALDVLLMSDALAVLAAEQSDQSIASRTPSLTLDVKPELHRVMDTASV
ncbi:hypothetical protein [Glutamicibacter creatinolyticus]|uniref:hypothetical protein n=1 Tax=Glutamicibacter creatinolyticus TaxID=162496 RepID=UPI0032179B9B